MTVNDHIPTSSALNTGAKWRDITGLAAVFDGREVPKMEEGQIIQQIFQFICA